ncbi:hypothetical protein [Thiorhodococcus fuscus]|uniref:Uncharacterized protein n=1 Tax=Thiorhodococcus fuscus TaxID=527200 RepID=A0ABW4Y569_9GAMM
MFKDTSLHFDPDLDQILNRVYGAGSNIQSEPGRSATSFRQSLVRRERGSIELKQALSELRDRREKAQEIMRMREELGYLQTQVAKLRELDAQIVTLRDKLDQEEAIEPVLLADSRPDEDERPAG